MFVFYLSPIDFYILCFIVFLFQLLFFQIFFIFLFHTRNKFCAHTSVDFSSLLIFYFFLLLLFFWTTANTLDILWSHTRTNYEKKHVKAAASLKHDWTIAASWPYTKLSLKAKHSEPLKQQAKRSHAYVYVCVCDWFEVALSKLLHFIEHLLLAAGLTI